MAILNNYLQLLSQNRGAAEPIPPALQINSVPKPTLHNIGLCKEPQHLAIKSARMGDEFVFQAGRSLPTFRCSRSIFSGFVSNPTSLFWDSWICLGYIIHLGLQKQHISLLVIFDPAPSASSYLSDRDSCGTTTQRPFALAPGRPALVLALPMKPQMELVGHFWNTTIQVLGLLISFLPKAFKNSIVECWYLSEPILMVSICFNPFPNDWPAGVGQPRFGKARKVSKSSQKHHPKSTYSKSSQIGDLSK